MLNKISNRGVKNKIFKFSIRYYTNTNIKLNTNIQNFNEEYIEMRSDVKTLPTKKMRESVQNAIFGDDMSGEDPTVNLLCKNMCELFGKEKALFVPSGTMGNMVSLGISCPKGSYLLQGERSHLIRTELGAQKQFGLIPFVFKEIDDVENSFNLEEMLLSRKFDKTNEIYAIAFENTQNYNGGRILNTNNLVKYVLPNIKNNPKLNHLKFHVDASRILNAAAASNIDPKVLVEPFDTVNFCLSKGVGAPVGSIVLMSEKDYAKALVVRQWIGGTMRQAGFLAAPALVALEDWRERFEIDHKNAKLLSSSLRKIKGLTIVEPDTNIVNIFLDEKYIKKGIINEFVAMLQKDFKVLVCSFDGDQYIRAVIHHQIGREKVILSVEAFKKTVEYFYI